MKYLLTTCMVVFFITEMFAASEDIEIPKPGEVKDWTIMVYMCADNNLETFAIKDLNEMEKVGSSSKMNIVVELDRWDGYAWKRVGGTLKRVKMEKINDDSNGDWTGTRRYFVKKDTSLFFKNKIISEQIGGETEKDLGDPANLKDFLKWGITNFPARKYLAIVWNHGAGFEGVAFDEGGKQSVTHISANDLGDAMQHALKEAVTSGNLKIDITGFDACLMNMYSIAYELKDAGKILLGSEEIEPGDGWPYDKFLEYLEAHTDANEETLAKKVVEDYIASCAGDGAATLAAVSLSPTEKLTAINAKLDALVDTLIVNDAAKDQRMTALQRVLEKVQKFERQGFIDLLHLCELIKSDFGDVDKAVASAAENVLKEISAKKLILFSKTTDRKMKNANGIAIYLPRYQCLINTITGERYTTPPSKVFFETEFAKNSKWDDLIHFYWKVADTLPAEIVSFSVSSGNN